MSTHQLGVVRLLLRDNFHMHVRTDKQVYANFIQSMIVVRFCFFVAGSSAFVLVAFVAVCTVCFSWCVGGKVLVVTDA